MSRLFGERFYNSDMTDDRRSSFILPKPSRLNAVTSSKKAKGKKIKPKIKTVIPPAYKYLQSLRSHDFVKPRGSQHETEIKKPTAPQNIVPRVRSPLSNRMNPTPNRDAELFMKIDSSKMPLEMFDEDKKIDMKFPQNVKSRFWINNQWKWEDCEALEYDEKVGAVVINILFLQLSLERQNFNPISDP